MAKQGKNQIIVGLVLLALWCVNYLVGVHYWDVFGLRTIYAEIDYRIFWNLPGGWGIAEVFFFTLLPAGFGLVTSGIATRKGRRFWPWFFLGFFLGFIGLIIALVFKGSADAKVEAGLKKCPHCSEWVDRSASQCRYCLGALSTPESSSTSEAESGDGNIDG